MAMKILALLLAALSSGIAVVSMMYYLVTRDFFIPQLFNLAKRFTLNGIKLVSILGFFVWFSYFFRWDYMSRPVLLIAIVLTTMSLYSIILTIERYFEFKSSQQQIQMVITALDEKRIDDAVAISKKSPQSHLATIINAGLAEAESERITSNSFDRR
jgi:hypothetical protein